MVDVDYSKPAEAEINIVEISAVEKKPDMIIRVTSNKKELIGAANPDTGAMCTVVSYDWIRQLDETHAISPLQSPMRLVAANGSTINYEGYIKLEIQFENARIFTRAIVSKDLVSRILIGKEDLIKLGVIHPDFPSTKTSFSKGATKFDPGDFDHGNSESTYVVPQRRLNAAGSGAMQFDTYKDVPPPQTKEKKAPNSHANDTPTNKQPA